MSNLPTPKPEPDYVCGCELLARSACAGLPSYEEHEGGRYCVLHLPSKSKSKSTDFNAALQRKLANKDFNFCGVWFPDELSFFDIDFENDVDFSFATFAEKANFLKATFDKKAGFFKATFSAEVDFRETTFSARADFREATFSGKVDFGGAKFSAEADFELATFTAQADFSAAAFEGDVEFVKINILATTSMEFQFARIDKSDHVSFHGAWLRPHWFVNVDAHNFNFFDVGWHWDITDEEIESLETKIDSQKSKDISSPLRLLAIAYRHLAVNAEENHRYEDASTFRYMAMDARRRETWHGFAFWKLSWWYWLASGYSERMLKAFLVLL